MTWDDSQVKPSISYCREDEDYAYIMTTRFLRQCTQPLKMLNSLEDTGRKVNYLSSFNDSYQALRKFLMYRIVCKVVFPVCGRFEFHNECVRDTALYGETAVILALALLLLVENRPAFLLANCPFHRTRTECTASLLTDGGIVL